MKKSILVIATICLAFAAQAQETYKILQIHKGTEVTHEVKLSDIDSISFKVVYTYNGHEYVDLGLPSGTLWATCNVGATRPEEYGDYFAWGEVEPKSYFDWSSEGDYKWGVYNSNASPNYGMTKYNNTDGKTVLDLDDDAAHVNWGGDWRMPTRAEFDELLSSCTWTWTSSYNGTGRAGYIVKSKVTGNTNSIFLPAAGYLRNSSFYGAGTDGRYWSSSLNTRRPNDTFYLCFFSDNYYRDSHYRYYGQSVRAVCSAK